MYMYSVRTLCYILILLFLSFTCVLMLSFHSTIAIDIFLTQLHDLFCGYILFYCFPRPVNLRFCRCFRQTGFFRRCCFKIAATTLYSRLSWNGCSLTSRARWNSVSASHKRPRFFISSPKLTKVRVSLSAVPFVISCVIRSCNLSQRLFAARQPWHWQFVRGQAHAEPIIP